MPDIHVYIPQAPAAFRATFRDRRQHVIGQQGTTGTFGKNPFGLVHLDAPERRLNVGHMRQLKPRWLYSANRKAAFPSWRVRSEREAPDRG